MKIYKTNKSYMEVFIPTGEKVRNEDFGRDTYPGLSIRPCYGENGNLTLEIKSVAFIDETLKEFELTETDLYFLGK